MAKRKAYKYKPRRNYDTIKLVAVFAILLLIVIVLPPDTEIISEESTETEQTKPSNEIELMLYIDSSSESLQTTDK